VIVRVQKECHAYTENTLEAISKIPSLNLGVGRRGMVQYLQLFSYTFKGTIFL